MRILEPTEENLALAGAAIAAGRLVAMPTETVYGLAAAAFDAEAVARVFEAKARPSFDPLIVHVADLEAVDRVVAADARARLVMERLWPGPLTLVLPKRPEVPGIVTSGLETVAIRMPDHEVARALIRAAGTPVAAPSANPFGYLSPTLPEHVARMLGDKVDYILDGGPCRIGVESTVLDLSGERPEILRPGGMVRERIEELLGPVLLHDRSEARPTAPGQLPSHYAPRTPLRLVERGALAGVRPRGRAAALAFDGATREALAVEGAWARVEALSEGGELLEASARLFALLHDLDLGGYEELWAERAPARGLGHAINDRLYKASEK